MSKPSTIRSIRTSNVKSGQQKRREEALQRQQAARRDLTDHARRLAALTTSSIPVTDLNNDQASGSGNAVTATTTNGQNLRQYYAQQLMQPEWLTDMPDDLSSDWVVMARPEGLRCLVIASHQCTISRHRNGSILHRFPSPLPNGSRTSKAGSGDDVCVLDCIFHEADSTYYVIDMMCWKGYNLYDCSAEFRLYWVQLKLAECAGDASQDQQRYPFVPVAAYTCTQGIHKTLHASDIMLATAEGLQSAYAAPVCFQRDGIYLLHKEGYYALDTSPLALLWKDATCSQYFIDTDAQGVPMQDQSVTLQYQTDQTVATADKPPVILGRMPSSFVQNVGTALRPGRLLKFDISDGGLQMQDGQPVGADLKYTGLANQRRGRADSCSKVLFQYLARRDPITYEMLLRAVEPLQEESMA